MIGKKETWYKIASHISEIDFSSNGFAALEINGENICLTQWQTNVYACTQKCPHAGGILADGYLDALGNIVCPLHHYKFSLKNGRNISGEEYFLKIYPVEIRDDGIYISINSFIEIQ